MDQQRSRVPDTHTTTEQPPTPEPAPPPDLLVAGCLYEAGFTTTGPHPRGGVAIARSIDDARQRLADMLIFCDPCGPSLNLRLKTSSTVQTGIDALVGTVTAWSAM